MSASFYRLLILLLVFMLNYEVLSVPTIKSIKTPSILQQITKKSKQEHDLTKVGGISKTNQKKIKHKKQQKPKIAQNTDVIELNVGGKYFMTTRETLTRVPRSILGAIFNGRWDDKLPTDQQGNIFLDFNPILFRHLLNQLRTLDTNNPIAFHPPSLPTLVKPFNKMLQKLGFNVSLSSNNGVVTFNVGGQTVTTRDKIFNQLSNINLTINITMNKNKTNSVFLDHNPKLFQQLLNHLREGSFKNICSLLTPLNRESDAFKRILSDLGLTYCILPVNNSKNKEIMATTAAYSKTDNTTVFPSSNNKTLIVLAAPSIKEKYYASKFKEIIDYMTNFANLVQGKDEVIILADDVTLPELQGKVPSHVLVEAYIDDIWMRDFSPVIPAKQIKFKYLPNYLRSSDAKYVEQSFEEWFTEVGEKYFAKTDLILDGGNVVDNAAGTRAIVTDRFLRDNPSLTKETAKQKLKELLGVNEVAIIPETPNDTTGHSDGVVTWPMDDKILLIKKPEPTHGETLKELRSSFPGVQIVELPDYTVQTTWKRFISAKNCFVNCIVTDDYMYMPMFNDGHDEEMLEVFKSHTNKTVVPIPSEHVAIMGGSVRCLSWQVKNANKEKILQSIKK